MVVSVDADDEAPEDLDMAPFMGGQATKACQDCGASLEDEAVFCPNCGTKYRLPERPVTRTRPKVVPAAEEERDQLGELVKIREDGSRGKSMPLYSGITRVGREKGDMTFPQDAFLSPVHCRFVVKDGTVTCEDLDSENGVFVKVDHPVRLAHSDVFRVGQELLQVELLEEIWGATGTDNGSGVEILGSDATMAPWAVLSQLIAPASHGRRFALAKDRALIGREDGDITFPEDGYISRTHAEVLLRDGQAELNDLGSSNGTYVRVRGTTTLPSGSLIMIGQQLFLVQY